MGFIERLLVCSVCLACKHTLAVVLLGKSWIDSEGYERIGWGFGSGFTGIECVCGLLGLVHDV
jgi:hypothetical protein